MKIKGIKTDNRLILFQIIKSKMYKKEVKYHNTKLNFKKAAKIIYEYHVNDKSILFFNFPGIVQKEINLLIDKTTYKFLFFILTSSHRTLSEIGEPCNTLSLVTSLV